MPDHLDELYFDRDELACALAEECDRLAERWWCDRRYYRAALKSGYRPEEPQAWLKESRPPVRTAGEVLGDLLTEYDPGEQVRVVEFLERCHWSYQMAEDNGARRLAHGYHRAMKSIRETSGLGYPDPDPILGEVS